MAHWNLEHWTTCHVDVALIVPAACSQVFALYNGQVLSFDLVGAVFQVPTGNNGTMEKVSMTDPLPAGQVTKVQLRVSQPLQDGIMYLAQVSKCSI